jgi:predicted ATPase
MSEALLNPSSTLARGAQQSLIESFGIRNLYGYRTISLSSKYAATILIAKNGTGKTTLLGALDAFLRTQFSRLRDLEFSEIFCKLRNSDELILTHDDLLDFLQVPTEGELVRQATRIGVEPSALFTFIIEEWPYLRNETTGIRLDNKIFSSIVTATTYNYSEAHSICDKLQLTLMTRNPRIEAIASTLRQALDEIEILYLPTYRRIELALRGDPLESPYRRRKRPKFDIATGSLFTGDIQFGLADISDRLAELNHQIVIESNNGYHEISANIINELIDNTFETAADVTKDLPSEDDLRLFFSRLREGRRVGPFPPVTAPNLDKLYGEKAVPEGSSKFLNYFLSKLGTVIRTTKAIELPVDEFIHSCNKYLASREPSTVLDDESIEGTNPSLDAKRLKLNRSNLKVHVESVPSQRKISLDALSSGEKQMISLFAKLFLYPKQKIVLIDEPELSLSIDWQRQILVDVLNAPLCRQVIAITHSPFVFDNALEPFARSLRLSVSQLPASSSTEDDLDD